MLDQGQRMRRKEQQRQPMTDHTPVPLPPVLLQGPCKEIMTEAELWEINSTNLPKLSLF